MIGQTLFLLFLLCISQCDFFMPTKYAVLEEMKFSDKTSIISYVSPNVEMLILGFGGDSFNVTMYLINITQPEKEYQRKKGPSVNYYFYDNLTDAKGNITAIVATPQLNVFGVGSADHIFRIYIPIEDNEGLKIIKYQQLTDSYGSIQFASLASSGEILAVVGQQGIIRFYLNRTVNIPARNQRVQQQKEQFKSKERTWQYKLFQSFQTHNDIGSIVFAGNQTTFYVGYDNGSLIGYQYNSKKHQFQFSFIISDTNRKITAVTTNIVGDILSTGSQDGFVRIYKTDIFKSNPKLAQGIYDANKAITKLSMRLDGKLLAATSADGWTRIYNHYGQFVLNDSIIMNSKSYLSNGLSSKGDIIAIVDGSKVIIYRSCVSSLSQCSHCSNLNNCTNCLGNYYLSSTDGFCHICSLLQGCKSCVTQNMCTSCYSGYFLNTQQGICEPCVNTLKNCRSCSSKFECTQCFLQFKLNYGICQFPQNPNRPKLIPLMNKTTFLPKDLEKVISPNINTHAWTLTLIILIIVLCSLIIVVLVVMIVLYVKFMKKLKNNTMISNKQKNQIQPINSSRTISVKDEIKQNEVKAPSQALLDNKLFEPKQSCPVALEPQQKVKDKFKQLRA